MNSIFKTTLCLAFWSSVLLVTAKASAEPGDNYLVLMGSGVIADDDRKVDDGFAGAEIAFGRVLDKRWNVEGALGFLNMPGDESGGLDSEDEDQIFLNINALNVYNRGGVVEPYLLGGLGYVKTTSYQQSDQSNVLVNLGGGLMAPIFEGRASLRAEILWRWENADSGLQDWIYNLGIVFKFGEKAAPPPPLPVVVVPVDADNDGVYDDVDQCLGTPAGELVDEFGCTLDTDADGVPDSKDQCPDTVAGKEVDEIGCAVIVIIELPGVTFRSSSEMLLDGSSTTLNKAAQSLLDNPNLIVEVAGHTDSVGGEDFNMDLSFKRADSVRSYLIEAGVDPTRVSARGYGEREPIADNETDSGRAANRRVELRVIED